MTFMKNESHYPLLSVGACVLAHLSRVWLFGTPWAVAHQAPLSMGFSRQECWSGLPSPPPGDLPSQGSNPHLLHCRWVLYPLSHLGSPTLVRACVKYTKESTFESWLCASQQRLGLVPVVCWCRCCWIKTYMQWNIWILNVKFNELWFG